MRLTDDGLVSVLGTVLHIPIDELTQQSHLK
jgi:hypothetical protein